MRNKKVSFKSAYKNQKIFNEEFIYHLEHFNMLSGLTAIYLYDPAPIEAAIINYIDNRQSLKLPSYREAERILSILCFLNYPKNIKFNHIICQKILNNSFFDCLITHSQINNYLVKLGSPEQKIQLIEKLINLKNNDPFIKGGRLYRFSNRTELDSLEYFDLIFEVLNKIKNKKLINNLNKESKIRLHSEIKKGISFLNSHKNVIISYGPYVSLLDIVFSTKNLFKDYALNIEKILNIAMVKENGIDYNFNKYFLVLQEDKRKALKAKEVDCRKREIQNIDLDSYFDLIYPSFISKEQEKILDKCLFEKSLVFLEHKNIIRYDIYKYLCVESRNKILNKYIIKNINLNSLQNSTKEIMNNLQKMSIKVEKEQISRYLNLG